MLIEVGMDGDGVRQNKTGVGKPLEVGGWVTKNMGGGGEREKVCLWK